MLRKYFKIIVLVFIPILFVLLIQEVIHPQIFFLGTFLLLSITMLSSLRSCPTCHAWVMDIFIHPSSPEIAPVLGPGEPNPEYIDKELATKGINNNLAYGLMAMVPLCNDGKCPKCLTIVDEYRNKKFRKKNKVERNGSEATT